MSYFSNTFYKRSKTGAVLRWNIEHEDNQYRTVSGQVNGNLIASEWTTCEGKNIGRSNETTPWEQAAAEVASRETAKLDEGYVLDLTAIDNVVWQSPMLAHEYNKVTAKKPLSFPVYSQPKLDGMRCIVNKDGMWSRNGKPIVSAPHIREALESVFAVHGRLEFDGELYSHKYKDDFNQIISLAKKSKPTAKDLEDSKEKLQYWVYDYRIVDGFMENYPIFSARLRNLKDGLAGKFEPTIRLLWTHTADNQQELDEFFQKYLEKGFEGQMVRLDKPYENCRTNSLLKRKMFQDKELPILDVIEGIGNRSGIAGAVVMEWNGNRFQAALKGDFEYCRNLLLNKDQVIGKLGTVKYQNLTPGIDGVPRFPCLIAVRDYE